MAVVTAVAAATIFRVFQLLFTVDYGEMGFYSAQAGFLPTYGFYLLLLILAAIFTAAVFIDSKKVNTAYKSDKNALTAKQTAALGIAFIIAACLNFRLDGLGMDFIAEVVLFIALAAIGFVILGNKKIKPLVGYLTLPVAVSYTLKSASLFMGDTIITRVSDELLLLLTYVSAVFFFLSLGRYFTDNESAGTRKKLMISASACACLSACTSLAGYIAFFINREYMSGRMEFHPVSEIGLLILAVTVVFALYGKKSEFKETDDETDNDKYETTESGE